MMASVLPSVQHCVCGGIFTTVCKSYLVCHKKKQSFLLIVGKKIALRQTNLFSVFSVVSKYLETTHELNVFFLQMEILGRLYLLQNIEAIQNLFRLQLKKKSLRIKFVPSPLP